MGIDESTNALKNALRREIKERLKKLDSPLRQLKSLEVSKSLDSLLQKSFPSYQSSTRFILGAYAPIQAEVDLFPTTFAKGSFQWAFPDYTDGKMVFRQCAFEDLEVTTVFGVEIRTPPETADIVAPDALLIPGLAFNKEGQRLGRGKGFYDRYLAEYQGVKVGLCFSEQIEVDVPHDDHDIQVDYVVSDAGIFGK